ncbi:hypothetical protein N0V83_004711 [Neocucurbitaria cava]|uniref:SET domain-containing protein n=1 Tax=Neocucurbitaria cava TaxID=798079 RepID=A0A9W8Y926_9PLEO|nr:hypothetical protein N0V83_004711 [Neocucurbitaria cava]
MASKDFSTHPLANDLVAWFTHNGGSLSPDVQVVNSASRGFHMRAVRPLSSPVVATCPLKLTLSSLNLDPNEKEVLHVESPLRQCQGKVPNHILTYLLLFEERNKGKASPWHAYIACLPGPESMTTPLWFDDEDMTFLAGTSLAPAARERKEDMRRQFDEAVVVMQELGIALANEINFDSFLWAATIFTSRAFISTHILPNRETIPLLFPVVDILNHSVSAKVEWDFQPHQSFSLKCLEGETFAPGQELFNNYAPKQNDELLLGYGFCLEDNPIEQFALKLVFPPELQEDVQEMGLMHPDNVPFGMSSTFLDTDPNTEQHFLRAKGHPFGRYENWVPYLRGIPPFIVHFFFIQTLLARDIDVRDVNIRKPDIRITLQVLALLHSALSTRCLSLPPAISLSPKTDKQKYAKIYRDGQAAIIHSVLRELEAAGAQLRIPPPPPSGSQTPAPTSRRPVLLSTADFITALEAAFPTAAQQFRTGLPKHALTTSYDDDPPSLDAPPRTTSLLTSYIHALTTQHPLPALEDGIADAETYTFIDEHLGDFLHLPSLYAPDEDASPIDVLDDLGLTFVNQPADGGEKEVFVKGKTENLGARVLMWGMKVAEVELFGVWEEGRAKRCLLVAGSQGEDGGEGGGDEWLYGDVVK